MTECVWDIKSNALWDTHLHALFQLFACILLSLCLYIRGIRYGIKLLWYDNQSFAINFSDETYSVSNQYTRLYAHHPQLIFSAFHVGQNEKAQLIRGGSLDSNLFTSIRELIVCNATRCH